MTTEPRSGDGEGNEREEKGKGVGVEEKKGERRGEEDVCGSPVAGV